MVEEGSELWESATRPWAWTSNSRRAAGKTRRTPSPSSLFFSGLILHMVCVSFLTDRIVTGSFFFVCLLSFLVAPERVILVIFLFVWIEQFVIFCDWSSHRGYAGSTLHSDADCAKTNAIAALTAKRKTGWDTKRRLGRERTKIWVKLSLFDAFCVLFLYIYIL